MFAGNVWILVRSWLRGTPTFPASVVARTGEISIGGVKHAHHGYCGDAVLTVEEIHSDHGMTTMRLTFRASVDAGLAADATRRIDVEFVTEHANLPRELRR
jgi:hypothetical protein